MIVVISLYGELKFKRVSQRIF